MTQGGPGNCDEHPPAVLLPAGIPVQQPRVRRAGRERDGRSSAPIFGVIYVRGIDGARRHDRRPGQPDGARHPAPPGRPANPATQLKSLTQPRPSPTVLLGLFGVLFLVPMVWLVLASVDSQASWGLEWPHLTLVELLRRAVTAATCKLDHQQRRSCRASPRRSPTAAGGARRLRAVAPPHPLEGPAAAGRFCSSPACRSRS